MKHAPKALDFALLIFISFVWGSSFMAIKIGLKTFEPFSLAAMRVVVAGVFMFTVARLKKEIFPKDKPTLKTLAIMGLFGSSAFILISWGQQYVPSSLAGIMLAFGPLNLLVLAHFLTHDEKISLPKVLGFVFGFAGVLLLFGDVGFHDFETEGIGMLALFVATLCYALSMIYIRKVPKTSALSTATGFLVMAAFVAVPLSLLFDPPWTHKFTLEGSLAILFLGVMSTGLSSILLIYLVKRVGATFSSYSNYLTPLVAVLWGVTFLGEEMTNLTWLALVLIMGGVGVSNMPMNKKSLP